MNLLILLLLPFFSALNTTEPIPLEKTAISDLSGAWTSVYIDDSGRKMRVVAILTELYFSSTSFAEEDGAFENTNGGVYSIIDDTMTLTYEFNTFDKTKVGQSDEFKYTLVDDKLSFTDQGSVWDRVDNGEPGALAGAWLITGRKQGEELRTMTPGARKTMKILSGSWFQWIAYNSETGEFFGTGGGEYTTKDGNYTEIIEFFSRDNDRVGASLQFNYEIMDGQWHHSGLSSKGEPIYEIWSPRNPAL